MKEIKIITIGGGSSYTPELAEGFINNFKNMPIKEWWLVDIDENDGPEKLDIIFKLIKRMFKKAGLENVSIRKTLNLVEALKDGADFVTTQLRVGQSNARVKDELIPIKHGMLGQETNGIGGLFKGLRTIPVIWDIIEKVKKHADGAWIVNFTNPSGMVTESVFYKKKYHRFIGVCNLPIHMRIAIAEVMGLDSWKDLQVDAAGFNHFVYFMSFMHKNKELFPKLQKMLDEGTLDKAINMKNVDDVDWNPILVKHLKAIPCAYHKYYYKRDLMIGAEKEAFKTNEVRAQVVQGIEKSLFDKYKDPNLAEKPKELEERGGAYYSTVAVGVVNAIYNDTNEEFVVSTLNNKLFVKNLPNDYVVETTTIIGKDGPKPVDREINAPENAMGLLKTMKTYDRLVIDAIAEKSKDKAIFAALIHPLSHDDILTEKVFNELFEAHKKYLEYFNK
ncbi:MAG: 6-phospho-beta-glucosidase [Mycoplasmataceae bacterium]|nr:6-phospho-beta-glucosidase [Mycoplasmataceae bacterium]